MTSKTPKQLDALTDPFKIHCHWFLTATELLQQQHCSFMSTLGRGALSVIMYLHHLLPSHTFPHS